MLTVKKIISALGLMLVALHAGAQVSANARADGILRLQESIVENGNNTWTYSFSMSNLAEVHNVWWVVLYTDLTPLSSTPFGDASHSGWEVMSTQANGEIVAPSGQANVVYSWAARDPWPWSAPSGIGLDQTVGGFSFTAAAYDNSPKAFFADVVPNYSGTNLGHNGNGSQIFDYDGMTVVTIVPEPAAYAMMMLGLGLLVLAHRRK